MLINLAKDFRQVKSKVDFLQNSDLAIRQLNFYL